MASHNRKDLTGKRFGRFVAIEPVETRVGKQLPWICRCDCGKVKTVLSRDLLSGNTKSCGCLRTEMLQTGSVRRQHGMTDTRIYNIWSSIKKRCNNPNEDNYYLYGGRGIKYCAEWENFQPFYDWAMANGYSDELSIDRINVNGDYSPENCRWATNIEQGRNKRNNHWITYNGETLIISEWDRRIGASKSGRVMARLNAGWSIKEAVTTKVGVRRKL